TLTMRRQSGFSKGTSSPGLLCRGPPPSRATAFDILNRALAVTLYHSGDFEPAQQHAIRAVQIWRSGNVQSDMEGPQTPVVVCLCYRALTEWHFGETDSCKATMAEAIPLAKELNDMPALAVALFFAAHLADFEVIALKWTLGIGFDRTRHAS